MKRISSASASEVPHGRRTVLLAFSYSIAALINGIYDVAGRAGWTVLDLRYYGMKVPRHCRPDGVLFRLGPDDGPLARRFLRLGVPVVQMNDLLFAGKCCCVLEDRRAIGRAAAEHFAQRGFRNMAYLHSEDHPDRRSSPLCQSFVEQARALGARADMIAVQRPGKVLAWNRFGALARRFEREISRLELPLGIFTYHDIMAIRICEYCQAVGLSVPEQVAVLGLKNAVLLCDFAPVPLSSVDPNHFEQGRIAAETLERLMNGQAPPAEPILVPPAGIVTRKSTDVLALPDVDTARALRYIWENFSEPLVVGDVADAVGLSRRKLERHFRAHLGRSVAEELTRKRIERSRELLTGTKLSARAIARQVGFSTETYFGKVFRKTMGMTPKKYRQAWTAKLGEGRAGEQAEAPGQA